MLTCKDFGRSSCTAWTFQAVSGLKKVTNGHFEPEQSNALQRLVENVHACKILRGNLCLLNSILFLKNYPPPKINELGVKKRYSHKEHKGFFIKDNTIQSTWKSTS